MPKLTNQIERQNVMAIYTQELIAINFKLAGLQRFLLANPITVGDLSHRNNLLFQKDLLKSKLQRLGQNLSELGTPANNRFKVVLSTKINL